MTASLLPGRAYTAEQPLLRVMDLLLQHRRFTVTTVAWGDLPPDDRQWPAHVREVVATAWDRTPPVVVVAKSLGTHALPLAVERGLAGVWLTPRLDHGELQDALAVATTPQLVVGGSEDPFWRSPVAPSRSVEVLELAGLDHALERPSDPHASVEALRIVLGVVEAFLIRTG